MPSPIRCSIPETPKEQKPAIAAKPKLDFGEERKKLLGTIPPTQPEAFETVANAEGDYVYEATLAKPLVEHSLKFDLAFR